MTANMVEHIVVGVDGSEASFEALRWGVAEAHRRHAAMKIVTCFSVPAYGAIDGALYPSALDVETMKREAGGPSGRRTGTAAFRQEWLLLPSADTC